MLRRAGSEVAGVLLTMEKTIAIGALGALAHEGRLDVFRLLVRAGPAGMAAGEIARASGAAVSYTHLTLPTTSRV